MVIALIGASGSGKSTIEKVLYTHYGYKKIVSWTTRKARVGEKNGEDYFFVDNDLFVDTLNKGLFAEHEEYSQNRLYGTLVSDYIDSNSVVVLTPNGFRNIKNKFPNIQMISVFVDANLGTRMKRYIDRCGVDAFSYDDKNEISARVERDFGMFCGIEKEVDLIVENNEYADVNDIAKKIVDFVEERR